MEPKLPAPNIGPEYSVPSYGQNLEAKPSLSTPENNIERGAERFEQRSEAAPPAAVATPILPAPVLPVPPPADDGAAPLVSDTPLVANDDDLIEKEWVDKAKQIIVQTKDDPYRREQEVGKLQADYLLKRYGKELGASQ
jgi:hypothetical protein